MPSFEEAYGSELRDRFPCCVLSGIPVFRPDKGESQLMGYEIDHLIHVRDGDLDTLFIIECKGLPIEGSNGNRPVAQQPWIATYNDRTTGQERRKDARRQVINHAIALIHFFEGYKRGGRPLKIEACVVSSRHDTPYIGEPINPQLGLHLSSAATFLEALKTKNVLRVEQSALLSQLRLGLRDADIGHPPINEAIRFISRCRNALDIALYQSFEPTKSHWAINGTAGMGKSGLLAYSLFVLATDQHVSVSDTDLAIFSRQLKSFTEKAAALGVPPLMQRVIHAVSLKQKQVDVLRAFWERYRREFSSLAAANELQFNEPVFSRWTGTIPDNCNVLLIDEAHDLDLASQQRVAEWLNDSAPDRQRYLAIACDRHQKLRIVGTSAPLIQGVNFQLKTRRLSRNYRNPFPVFCSGLGIMFRWFNPKGPKILPSRQEILNGFGLEVRNYPNTENGDVMLGLRNDSHPANHWSFTSTLHESASDAFAQLAEANLNSQDVLWVRFSHEDSLFDYEQLSDFTYHNCCTDEAAELVDKYIKGQEYPVVVIEGMPSALNQWEERGTWSVGTADPDEVEMWRARRILYLCASRATAFLIFVAGESQRLARPLRDEILQLVKQLGCPAKSATAGSEWVLGFEVTEPLRPMDVFDEEVEVGATDPKPEVEPIEFEKPSMLVASNLANKLGLDVERMLVDLRAIQDQAGSTLESGQPLSRGSVLRVELVEEFAQKYGYRILIPQNEPDKPDEILLSPELLEAVTPEDGHTLIVSPYPTIRELARLLGCQPSEVMPDVRNLNVNERVTPRDVERLCAGRGYKVHFTAETPPPPAAAPLPQPVPEIKQKQPREAELLQLTIESRFRASTAIERYMEFLRVLLRSEDRAKQAMLDYRPGRHRILFARSAREIEASGNTTMPVKISGSEIFALTNLSNETKRTITNDILTRLQYSLPTRKAVCDWILGRNRI